MKAMDDEEEALFGQIPDPGEPPTGDPTQHGPQIPVKPPEFDRKNCKCMQDCRYFMSTEVWLEVGNTTLPEEQAEPRVVHLSCTVQPGVYRQITKDAPVLECNMWDPMTAGELEGRERRRKMWKQREPKSEESHESE